MRLTVAAVLLAVVALLPAAAFAGGGDFGLGVGNEYGCGVGVNWEFKTSGQIAPTLGASLFGVSGGANYYFTDEKKNGSPRGWRAQLLLGLNWYELVNLSLTAGQRSGNWDWGVGVRGGATTAYFGIPVYPEVSWGYRF